MEIIRTFAVAVKHYQRRMAEALCPKCGKTVIRQYSNAKKQMSCGCDRKELRGEAHHMFKHGRQPPQLYKVWKGMRSRCQDKNDLDYGGRGISVAVEWESYPVFRDWSLAHGWRQGLEIDRTNNNGNYGPDNCRFATRAKNCQNKRNTKLTEEKVLYARRRIAEGATMRQIGKEIGVSDVMVAKIRDNKSWSVVTKLENQEKLI